MSARDRKTETMTTIANLLSGIRPDAPAEQVAIVRAAEKALGEINSDGWWMMYGTTDQGKAYKLLNVVANQIKAGTWTNPDLDPSFSGRIF